MPCEQSTSKQESGDSYRRHASSHHAHSDATASNLGSVFSRWSPRFRSQYGGGNRRSSLLALGIATAATLASPGSGFVDLVAQPPRFKVGAAKRENVIRPGPARVGNRVGCALLPGLAINRLALLGHEAP